MSLSDDELALLARVVVAAERIAASHERFCRVMELANDIDLDAITEPVAAEPPRKKGEPAPPAPPDPFAAWTDDQEESAAAIEWLEEAGVRVPAAAYKRLGIDSPEREDEPTMDDLEADQPGADAGAGASADDAEPVSARREH